MDNNCIKTVQLLFFINSYLTISQINNYMALFLASSGYAEKLSKDRLAEFTQS